MLIRLLASSLTAVLSFTLRGKLGDPWTLANPCLGFRVYAPLMGKTYSKPGDP